VGFTGFFTGAAGWGAAAGVGARAGVGAVSCALRPCLAVETRTIRATAKIGRNDFNIAVSSTDAIERAS